MTTYKQVKKIEHSIKNPLFPLCGKSRDHFGHEWTPGGILRHEMGCGKCQRLLDPGLARRQSEYRLRLNPYPDDFYLDELPFAIAD